MVIVNQKAMDVADLADRLAKGYLSHLTAISIATHPRARELAPEILPDQLTPLGFIGRKNARPYEYGFLYHLDQIKTDPVIADEMTRVWLTGSVLTLGDALAKVKDKHKEGYFDRAPILELVRHLRNGVAHGNRFNIRERVNFGKHPAHNLEFADESEGVMILEMTHALQGKRVLFEFIDPVGVLDVLRFVSNHLNQIGQKLKPEPFLDL